MLQSLQQGLIRVGGMENFVLRIIVIELFSVEDCPLEEASEHCFL